MGVTADLRFGLDLDTRIYRNEMRRAAQDARRTQERIDRAGRGRDPFRDSRRSANRFRRELDAVRDSFSRLRGSGVVWLGLLTAGLVRAGFEIAKAAAETQSLRAQLQLVAREGENVNSTFNLLFQQSQDLGVAFRDNVTLYTKLARATQSLGLSQLDLINATEAINRTFAISGTSADNTSLAIEQLTQGLALGVLRGQDYKSVASVNARLTQVLADEFGVTADKVKQLADSGQLANERLVNGLLKSLPQLRLEADLIGDNVEKSARRITNAIKFMVSESDPQPLTDALNGLASRIADPFTREQLAAVASLIQFMASLAVRFGSALVQAFAIVTSGLRIMGVALAGAARIVDAIFHLLRGGGLRTFFNHVRQIASDSIALSRDILARDKKLTAEQNARIKLGLTDAKLKEEAANAEAQRQKELKAQEERRAQELERQATQRERQRLRRFERDAKRRADVEISEAERARDARIAIEDEIKAIRENTQRQRDASRAEENQTGFVLDRFEQQGRINSLLREGNIEAAAEEARALLELAPLIENEITRRKFEAEALMVLEQQLEATKEEEKALAEELRSINQIQPEISIDDSAIDRASDKLRNLITLLNTPLGTVLGGGEDGTLPEGFRRGGAIPGYGGGDKVPALLERGEFVLRKEAVRMFGRASLYRMNRLIRRPARFQSGGLVAEVVARRNAALGQSFAGLSNLTSTLSRIATSGGGRGGSAVGAATDIVVSFPDGTQRRSTVTATSSQRQDLQTTLLQLRDQYA